MDSADPNEGSQRRRPHASSEDFFTLNANPSISAPRLSGYAQSGPHRNRLGRVNVSTFTEQAFVASLVGMSTGNETK